MAIPDVFKSAGVMPRAFLLGMLCAAAQVLFFRELLACLYGNELLFTGLMAAWSVGIAGGSAWGRRIGSGWPVLLLGVALFSWDIWACRHVRGLLGWPVGVSGDILPSLLVSVILVFPPAFILGGYFAALAAGQLKKPGTRIYAAETLGFAAGALLMVVFFLSPFSQVSVASRSPQWPGYKVVAARETPLASFVVAERQGETSLFESGLLVATTHDRLTAEESVHYALLAHPSPKRVLLIGGAATGAVEEAIKHPGLKVDVLEPDRVVFDLARTYFPDAAKALLDPRVRAIMADGRRLLRTSRERYDAVIVLVGDPCTLLANRYYTADFFVDVKAHLSPGGMMSVALSASENYVNEEGRAALGGIRSTLASVFEAVRVIPGGKYIFLAASRPGDISIEPGVLAERLKARGIQSLFVRPEYFNERLGAYRVKEAADVVSGGHPVNRDIRPAELVGALSYWASQSGSAFPRITAWFRTFGLWLWIVPFLVFLVTRFNRGAAAPFVAGFGQMLSQTVSVALFQSVFGNIYSLVGLLTAGVMLGLFVGAREHSRGHGPSPFLAGALLFTAAAVIVPLIAGNDLLAGGFFAVFPFLAGLYGGRQFTSAVTGERTGAAYTMDVLGSGLGALLGGLFLIPFWGIPQALLFAAAMQLALSF
ncbi:MAG: hypothetical protein WCO69_03515 [Candidatus Omnitrophota bacterium]